MAVRSVPRRIAERVRALAAAAAAADVGTEEERRSKALVACQALAPYLAQAVSLLVVTDAAGPSDPLPPEAGAPAPAPPPKGPPAPVLAELETACACGHPLYKHTIGPPHYCAGCLDCKGFAPAAPEAALCARCGHGRHEHVRPSAVGLYVHGCAACGCPRFYAEAPASTDWRDRLDGFGEARPARRRPPPPGVRIEPVPDPGSTAEMWDDVAFGEKSQKKF